MAVYRLEIDALNAIVKQNERIIELLEDMKSKETAAPITDKPKRPYTRRTNENAS